MEQSHFDAHDVSLLPLDHRDVVDDDNLLATAQLEDDEFNLLYGDDARAAYHH